MNGIVVDASVAVKWCLPLVDEQFVPQAAALLDGYLGQEIRFLVPDLFWNELTNALCNAVRRSRVAPLDAELALIRIQDLNIPTVSSAPFLLDAFRLAVSYDRAVYDSAYVVLAVQSGVELVTADERLANALAAYLPVKWLGAL